MVEGKDKVEVIREELAKIIPSPDKKQRVQQLKTFIREHLMMLRKDEAIEFITLELDAFAIDAASKTILKNFYTAEKKDGSKNKAQDDLNINPKYKGMYTITVSSNDGFVTVTPHTDKIAEMVMDGHDTITYKDQIYVYQDGYYQIVTEIINQSIVQIIKDICKGANSNKIIQYENSAMEYIRRWNIDTEFPFNKHKNALNVANGVLLISPDEYKLTLVPHDPKMYLFNYMLPVEYDENAPTEPIYNELLKYMEDPTYIIQPIAQAFLQVLGYGPYKLFYVWQGGRDVGKTTASELIEATVGASARSTVGLNEFSTSVSRFNIARLEGKLINICDDMSYFKMDDVGIIKKIVGKYDHEVEKKGIQSYNATLTASHIFITNTPPSFDRRIKNEEAFWDKVIYVEFKNHLPKDYTYKQRVFTKENISGFFNLIINMVMESIVTNSIPIIGDAKVARESWMKAGNPLYMFLLENMHEGGETAFMKQDLVDLIQVWAEDNGKDAKIIPKTTDDIVDHIKVCGGSINQRRRFNGEEKDCYVLPWTWNFGSKYIRSANMCNSDQLKLFA